MFQIVRMALDDNGEVIARRALQPLFELWEDAVAMAEFDASRLWGITAGTRSKAAGGRPIRVGRNIVSRSKPSPPPKLRRESTAL
jgi:hypothetical protein